MTEPTRACLHCALARALRAEAPALARSGLEVRMSRSDPVFLPETGAAVYRKLRRLLATVRATAERGWVKLSVIDLPGKSHVEVTAVVGRERGGWQVLAAAFPQFDPATIAGGFDESAGR